MTFPASLDSFGTLFDNVDDMEAANINELRRAIEYLEAKVGIDSSGVTSSLDYKVNNFIASGRKLWIYENTAPIGWSISSVADRVLGIAGGSLAYSVGGGNLAGSWTLPNHTLTTNEIPSHTHGIRLRKDHGSINYDGFHDLPVSGYAYDTDVMQAVGGGASHNHGSNFRPAAAVGIIIEKD